MDEYGGMLDGVTVLDLTQFIAGPYGTQYLADLGADVIKVEQPGGGDLGRGAGTDFVHGESVHFWGVNKNKRSVVLDLKSDRGREVFYRMVGRADVVFDNFRPGVVERLGVDYERLSALNPRIICTSVSAYGQDGPDRDQPGYDLSMQAVSGVMSLTGEPDGPPVRAGTPIGDLVGGMAGAMGTIAALYHRETTGRGQRVDVALLDSQISLLMYWATIYLATGRVPGRVGSGHPEIVPYGAFPTRDAHMILAIFGDRFFRLLCDTLGLDELAQDPALATNYGRVQHRDRIIDAIAEVTKTRTTHEWLAVMRDAGIPAARVNSVGDALEAPQIAHRRMIVEVDHPLAGAIRLVGNPVKSTSEREVLLAPPLLGQHTKEVLAELAGLNEKEIAELDAAGITRPTDRRLHHGDGDGDDEADT